MKSLLTAIALTVASTLVAAAESATKNVYVGSADQGKSKAQPVPHAMDQTVTVPLPIIQNWPDNTRVISHRP